MLFAAKFMSRYSGFSTRLLDDDRLELGVAPVASDSATERGSVEAGVGGTANPLASRVQLIFSGADLVSRLETGSSSER